MHHSYSKDTPCFPKGNTVVACHVPERSEWCMVPRMGVEPMIFWMRTRCPGPLDERGVEEAYIRSGTFIPSRPSPSWSIVQTEAVIFKRNCLSVSEPSRMGVVL